MQEHSQLLFTPMQQYNYEVLAEEEQALSQPAPILDPSLIRGSRGAVGASRTRGPTGVSGEGRGWTEAPWMSVARGELGQRELPKNRHNPRILEYHATTTLRARDDETPWCSSFCNWVMRRSGYEGTNSARALSWRNRNWGQRINRPAVGAIAIIDWGRGKGHVGFVAGRSGNRIVLLGGNQSNMVRYSPFDRNRIVEYRVPTGYAVPPEAYVLPEINVGGQRTQGFRGTR